MKKPWTLVYFLLILALMGCAPPQPQQTESPPVLPTASGPTNTPPTILSTPAVETQLPPPQPTSTSPGVETQMPPTDLPLTPALQVLVEKARQDLAKRLSVPTIDITVAQVTEVTWPDSSLGCPQRGMAYAQVLTPGYLIQLEYAPKKYEFHATRGNYVIYCKDPAPPLLGTPGNS